MGQMLGFIVHTFSIWDIYIINIYICINHICSIDFTIGSPWISPKPQVRYMSATQLSALAAVPAAGAACGSVATMAGGAVGQWGRRVNKNG